MLARWAVDGFSFFIQEFYGTGADSRMDSFRLEPTHKPCRNRCFVESEISREFGGRAAVSFEDFSKLSGSHGNDNLLC